MIELTLTRRWFTPRSTIGILDYNGAFFCYTLEDLTRKKGIKIPDETAIPPGEYPFAVSYSPRFKTRLPLIQAVPGFEGIRIHSGNDSADTSGCILVGLDRDTDKVTMSRLALQMLLDRMKKDGEQGTIKIVQNLTVL